MCNFKIVFANILWLFICFKDWILFQFSCYMPHLTQKRVFRKIMRNNANTIFGQRHNFSSITTVDDFRHNVSLSTYENYDKFIEDIKLGIHNVLTKDCVKMLEPTSGSSNVAKLIPYTNQLKREFLCGIRVWIFDIFMKHKYVMWNKMYWSITPMVHNKQQSNSKIPIGFESDSAYFSNIENVIIAQSLSIPPEIGLLNDIENCQYVTSLFLLRDEDLAFISVWSPTFLLVILDKMCLWKDALINDIACGTLTMPNDVEAGVVEMLREHITPLESRASELAKIIEGENQWHALLWKKLSLISCWGDNESRYYARCLEKLFPQTHIQPKGLIATEAFVSLPITGIEGSVLSIRSHFFEFIEIKDKKEGGVLLIDELRVGGMYEVVVTTSGGLYRYRLGDKICVTGFYKKTPIIKFVGRSQYVSDIVGEKLNAIHVKTCIERVFSMYSFSPKFYLMAPECDEKFQCFYTIFIEHNDYDDKLITKIVSNIEQLLCENFHYKYCRDIGQLLHLKPFYINSGGMQTYLSRCNSLGQRIGDVKPMVLHKTKNWSKWFGGNF